MKIPNPSIQEHAESPARLCRSQNLQASFYRRTQKAQRLLLKVSATFALFCETELGFLRWRTDTVARLVLAAVCTAALLGVTPLTAQGTKPNVVFIIFDDLNDWVEGLGGHPQAKTPNITRLSQRGVLFTNAHSNAPICAPSRASLFSGILPHRSGVVEFLPFAASPLLKNSVTLFEHFKNHGYQIFGTGKLYHYPEEFAPLWVNPDGSSNYGAIHDYGPFPDDGLKKPMQAIHPALKFMEGFMPDPKQRLWQSRGEHSFGPLSDVPREPEHPGWRGWWFPGFKEPMEYKSEAERDPMPDERYAKWAGRILRRKHDKPFLLGVGFMRPHTPLYVPKQYIDLFPLEKVQLPPHREDDLEDCREFTSLIQQYGFQRHALYQKANLWKRVVQAYLASIAYADAQLGVLLEALDEGPNRDNTLIVLTSDHGFHLGEKNYNFKLTNWEESSRVPLVVVPPGAKKLGQTCGRAVSLIDVYPTLIDYCSLPPNPNQGKSGQPLDGRSVKPLVDAPTDGTWHGSEDALIAVFGETKPGGGVYHNFSIRSDHWRYTLYENGAEELYDHRTDPNEWTNLARDPAGGETKAAMKQTLLRMLGRPRNE